MEFEGAKPPRIEGEFRKNGKGVFDGVNPYSKYCWKTELQTDVIFSYNKNNDSVS